jgi:hypothetical protein
VVGGGGGALGGEINQALYAHMNNKRKMKKKKERNTACKLEFSSWRKSHFVPNMPN